jgi:hypothetical protein
MASVQGLEGRWEKLFAVLAWRFGKDGFIIRKSDLSALPVDRVLLIHGHAEELEFRFVPPDEARRIAEFERDNEGKIVTERL